MAQKLLQRSQCVPCPYSSYSFFFSEWPSLTDRLVLLFSAVKKTKKKEDFPLKIVLVIEGIRLFAQNISVKFPGLHISGDFFIFWGRFGLFRFFEGEMPEI